MDIKTNKISKERFFIPFFSTLYFLIQQVTGISSKYNFIIPIAAEIAGYLACIFINSILKKKASDNIDNITDSIMKNYDEEIKNTKARLAESINNDEKNYLSDLLIEQERERDDLFKMKIKKMKEDKIKIEETISVIQKENEQFTNTLIDKSIDLSKKIKENEN